jgi:hypothetical protein
MVSPRVAVYSFASLPILLTISCNNVLGVNDVTGLPPDAAIDAAPVCDLARDLPFVVSNSTTSALAQCSNGAGTCLRLLLNADQTPDVLSMELFDGFGGHGLVNAAGTYAITAADSRPDTCGICLTAATNFDSKTSKYSGFYFASAQGTLMLTTMDGNGAIGRLTGLKLRHANITNGTIVDLNDGCTSTIEDVEFTASYSGNACAPACPSGSVCAFDGGHQTCCPSGFPDWCSSLQVCFSNMAQRNNACTNAYYGDPSVGCKAGQTQVSITGATGSFCAPACSGAGSACPKPYAGTATGACSLFDTGSSTPSHCALSCTDFDVKGGQCPTAMTCRRAPSGNGYCLY